MASTDTFQCNVITPEQSVLECEATFAAFPAHDGEMGVLNNRAPLVCKLGIGMLRIEVSEQSPDRKEGGPSSDRKEGDPSRDRKEAEGGLREFFIDGGFAQVSGNRLTILTEQARKPEEVDHAASQQAMIEARAMTITDDNSYTARDNAVQRARVQLKISK